MRVRGWGFSCQIPPHLEQSVAVTVKLAFPWPAESRAQMLHPSSSSLSGKVACTLLPSSPGFMMFPNAFFFFPETLSMQKHQMPPGWVAPISNILSAVSRQTAALPGTQKVTNRGFLHTGSLLFVHWIHDALKIAHQLHAKEAEDALSRTSSHQKFKLLQS